MADKTTLLFEVLERTIDNRGKPPPISATGYPLVEVKHIQSGRLYPVLEDTKFVDQSTWNTWFRGHLEPGDILFSTVGSIARSCIVPDTPKFCIAQNVLGFRVNKSKADPRYIYYAINGEFFQHEVHGRTIETVQKSIKVYDLKTARIPLPTLPEQRAIAHILGTLDDKIELNRRMNETLEAMAQALFKSWFVDFDPVRAKAKGRNPGLPQPIADLFPDRFEDSELGEIPARWEVKKLSDLCSTQYGYTASAVDEPVGPKLLRVTDINKRNWIEWADVPHCVIEADARASYALQVGDLVVARMADPGKSAIIEEKIDAVFASYLVRLKTASLAHSYYVYGFLKSDLYSEYAEGAKSGSVQANMNAKVITGASLVVPPTTVMEQFLGAVIPLRQCLVAHVRESSTLAAIRDTLLPKLISGELRVKDVERIVGRCL